MTPADKLLHDAMTVDDRLDDVTRARMWSQLERRLQAEPAPRSSGRRWGLLLALAAGVLGSAAVVLGVSRGGDPGGPPVSSLVAPAHTTLATPLGPHTRAALVGPAAIDIVGEPADATTVRLRGGRLLAEFTGGPGRSLRVVAPGMTVDIVGTLFAVEIAGSGSCVSVAHGRVRATIGAEVREVGGGEELCSEAAAVRAIRPEMQEALLQHEAVLTARAAAPPAIAVPAPRSPAPAPATIATPPPGVPTTPAIAVPARRSPAPASAAPDRAPTPTAVPPRVVLAARPPPAPTPAVDSPSSPPPVLPPPPAPPVASTPAPGASATPPVAESPAPPPRPTAEDRYRAAELGLAHHDAAAADRALAQLIDEYPTSELVDQALYERARIAYTRHAWSEARRQLDALAARPASTLAEPGRYLACRIAIDAHDGDAARCIVDYRAATPSGPHDVELLGALVGVQQSSGGCSAARGAIDELAARYPRSAAARTWLARCPAAAAAPGAR